LISTYGLLSLKNRFLKNILIFSVLIFYIFNVINYKNAESFSLRINGFKLLADNLNRMITSENDTILCPAGDTDILEKYIKKTRKIHLNHNNIENNDKTKQDALKFFDKNFVLTTNYNNLPENIMPYIISPYPTKELTEYINSSVKQMPKGSKLFFVDYLNIYSKLKELRNYLNSAEKNEQTYNFIKLYLFNYFEKRFYEDLYNLLDNNTSLKKITTFTITIYGKCWTITVYKKIN
jgi:hypothetical protein